MARQASSSASVPRDCGGIQRLLALSDRFLVLQPTDSDGAIDLSDELASSGCILSLVEVSRLMGATIPHFADLREHADKDMARHAGEVAAYVLSANAISKASRVAAEAAKRLGNKCPKSVASCAQRWVRDCGGKGRLHWCSHCRKTPCAQMRLQQSTRTVVWWCLLKPYS